MNLVNKYLFDDVMFPICIIYICMASSYRSGGSHDHLGNGEITLIRLFLVAPGSVSITGMTAVVEGADDLTLTCNIPPGDEGNPDVYSYYWKNPGSTDWVNTTRVQTVNRNTLIATLHQGTWQCQAGNTAGNTSSATVTVTVNG